MHQVIAFLALGLAVPSAEAELGRFPSKLDCDAALEAHQRWREYQRAVIGNALKVDYVALDQFDEDCTAMRMTWEWLREAHEYPELRWSHLEKLRGCIGEAAYFTGQMPPAIPLPKIGR